MAVKRDRKQKKEAAAFVEALYQRGGWATAADMAAASDVHQTTISAYRNAQAMPEGYNLLRLIHATATRVQEDDVSVALEAVPVLDLGEAIQRLEAVVARLSRHLDDPPETQAHGQRP